MRLIKGFTLIEVLLALGLVTTISFGFGYLYIEAATKQALSNRALMSGLMTTEINSVVSDPTACINTFSPTINPTVSTNISHIKDALGNNIFSTGNSYFGAKLLNMRIHDFKELATTVELNKRSGVSQLEIEFDLQIPNRTIIEKHTIPLLTVLDSANHIVSCANNFPSQFMAFCTSLGGTFTAGGKCRDLDVGAGLTLPPTSDIQSTSTTAYASADNISVAPGGTLNVATGTITAHNNVTVGGNVLQAPGKKVIGSSAATITNPGPVSAPTARVSVDFCTSNGCRQLANQLCANNNYFVSSINPDGSVNCTLRPW